MELMQNLWNTEDQRSLEMLKKDILSGPTLARPDPSRRFYTKTYWYKDVTGALILQADVSEEAIKSEAQEKADGKCEFDKSLEGILLRPISLISRLTMSPLDNLRHIFLVKSGTVRWAIVKFRKYVWVSEFTVLSDYSGQKQFF